MLERGAKIKIARHVLLLYAIEDTVKIIYLTKKCAAIFSINFNANKSLYVLQLFREKLKSCSQQPYKATPRAAAVKYSVARSKHMRRIKYALSPISGRKLYPLEPSKTNQPTYASSGQIGSRVTASGIKYTYLLEKVLQGCSSFLSEPIYS